MILLALVSVNHAQNMAFPPPRLGIASPDLLC